MTTTYLSRGKRSILEQQYLADVRAWAKLAGIPCPNVKVRRARGGRYRVISQTISVRPDCHRDSLIHEFAHHLDALAHKGRGHGPSFRVALVQAATLAYGRADKYGWAGEYVNVRRWAQAHGLVRVS